MLTLSIGTNPNHPKQTSKEARHDMNNKKRKSASERTGDRIGRAITDNLHLLHALLRGEEDGDRGLVMNNNINNHRDRTIPAQSQQISQDQRSRDLILLQLQQQQGQQLLQSQWQKQQHYPNQRGADHATVSTTIAGQDDLRASLFCHDQHHRAVEKGGLASHQEKTEGLLHLLISSLYPASTSPLLASINAASTSSIPRSINIGTSPSSAASSSEIAALAGMNGGRLMTGQAVPLQEQLLLLLSRFRQPDQTPFLTPATAGELVNRLTTGGLHAASFAPSAPASPTPFLPPLQTSQLLEGLRSLPPLQTSQLLEGLRSLPASGSSHGGVGQGTLLEELLATLTLQRQQQTAVSDVTAAMLRDPAMLSALLGNTTAASSASASSDFTRLLRHQEQGRSISDSGVAWPPTMLQHDTQKMASTLLSAPKTSALGLPLAPSTEHQIKKVAEQHSPMDQSSNLHKLGTVTRQPNPKKERRSSNSTGGCGELVDSKNAGNENKTMKKKRQAPSSPSPREGSEYSKEKQAGPAHKRTKTGQESSRESSKKKHQPKPFKLTSRPPLLLALKTDEGILSPYQAFLRKQIQVFETKPEQLGGKAQGRNTPIVAGQVGIQCKYCASKPSTEATSGSIFYSHTLSGLYQIAQNMCKTHFLCRCVNIPVGVRKELEQLQKSLNRGSGGKQYWKDAAEKLGIIEDDSILKFVPNFSPTDFTPSDGFVQEIRRKEARKGSRYPAVASLSPVSSQKRSHTKQRAGWVGEQDERSVDLQQQQRHASPSSLSMPPSSSNSSTSEQEHSEERKLPARTITNPCNSSSSSE